MSFIFSLVLFIISLAGIIFLVERRVFLLKKIDGSNVRDFIIDMPDPEEVKIFFSQRTKRYGYIILIYTIRTYVIGVHKSKKILQRALLISKFLIFKMFGAKEKKQNPEVSRFLKTIGDYKNKINTIKSQIKEEEGIK